MAKASQLSPLVAVPAELKLAAGRRLLLHGLLEVQMYPDAPEKVNDSSSFVCAGAGQG